MKLSTLIQDVMKGTLATSKDLEDAIEQLIGEIDQLISIQHNEILHHDEFQKLEASWRGLYYLVNQTETSTMIKIRVLNVAKHELRKDFEKAIEFDQSILFKKVHDDIYGVFWGEPFGAIIGDFEFGSRTHDMRLLEHISHVAAAVHAPFLSAASSEMFNFDSFTDILNLKNLSNIFENVAYIIWKGFRESEDSRFVGLTLPHVLMRLPYGPETAPVEAFNFKEDVDGKDHKKYLWGNAAYAVGCCLTNEFAKYGWWGKMYGPEGGGLVEGLPTYFLNTDDDEFGEKKYSTEIAITKRREKDLRDLGFIPLVRCRGTGLAAFFGMSSCRKPENYEYAAANTHARLVAQLQYVLVTSRFAHYLKAIVRDNSHRFRTRQNCEDYLNTWLSNYVHHGIWDSASMSSTAQYPLERGQRIDVKEVHGEPGAYQAVVYIKPQFRLDELPASLRTIVKLPPFSHRPMETEGHNSTSA